MRKAPTDPTGQDHAFHAARAALSTLPFVGGPLQVLFESIFTEPLEKRKSSWLAELCQAIEQIQSRVEGFESERLSTNEAFITTALQASQIALRNHQKEKLAALRNAVLNSGLPNSPSEDEQAIFLRLVDQLTAWHLRILFLLDNPIHWLEENKLEKPSFMGGTGALLKHCFPQLKEEPELYSQMVKELQAAGLAAGGSYMNAMMTVDGVLASRTTVIGKRFISFISDPEAMER